MIYAGIDSGSRTIKVVLLDGENNSILGSEVTPQGVHQNNLAMDLLQTVSSDANVTMEDITYTVATGYGRDALESADTTITEITCHARGVHHLSPEARTVIDIGGQDSKLLRLEENGRVRDFAMNDRCAAGTGRFLEVVSEQLDVPLKKLGEAAEKADKPASISSMCVVFAETEIIGLLAAGESIENIIAGIQTSIASRIASMGGRNITDPVAFTGGVAMVPGMDIALSNVLDRPVSVSEMPQLTGALGAAILAKERFEKTSS
jgi:predicted CoA-substrate-specific enzyme activase